MNIEDWMLMVSEEEPRMTTIHRLANEVEGGAINLVKDDRRRNSSGTTRRC